MPLGGRRSNSQRASPAQAPSRSNSTAISRCGRALRGRAAGNSAWRPSRRATHNARTINGVMVVEGDQVVVGDTFSADVVAYEVLCRRHHTRRMTAATAMHAHMSPTPLPFDEPAAR